MDVGGVRAATLLAMLALRAGVPVSADALIDGLWASEPPDGAATTLRSYVSRLRIVLGEGAAIDRVDAGYVLTTPSGSIDVARFEALAREGRELVDRLRHRRAADVLRQALDLWRDRPFAGLPDDGIFRTEAARLEELHLLALESRLEADLELGRGAELVDELESLVAAHPFRERLWRHLMLALYRAGRQADALAAYHRARSGLDDELGLEPGPELQALEAAILRHDVPPARSVSRGRVRLPVALTSFVGREQEMRDVRALLARARLVTLVGVGGVGKTRLAMEVARHALEDVVDDVAFVDLAAIADASLVPAHVAAALGAQEQAGQAADDAISEHLGDRDVLLVLDNCEHLRAAAASLAQGLLAASRGLRVLATSREVLDVPGEAPYPVPPLALPTAADTPETARGSEAVRLLLDRASLTRHDLRVDDAAYATAARICRELDGLPLAIELAAARAKALTLEEIAERLRDRFRFLVSWRRLSAARHRTLAEAMDWSYELLAPDEQLLLTRLAVFPAGGSLPSVAAVCLDGDEPEAERLLERLVDASLVVPVESGAGTRYRLLETVRQYAAARLPEPERPALDRRHAERALAIAATTNLGLESGSHAGRFDLARLELPSIRAAIGWAADTDPPLAVSIASAMERFWAFAQPLEGIALFDGLLAREGLSEADRAKALRCRGGCRYASGDYAGGVEDYAAALAIHERLDQPAHRAHLLMRIAVEAHRAGDLAEARRLLDEAAAIGGDARFGPDLYVALEVEADLAFAAGRHDEGFELLVRANERARGAGDAVWQVDSLQATADRALELGRFELAGDAAREALSIARPMGTRSLLIWSLSLLARHAAATGAARRAGRLWGGLEAEVDRGGRVGQWESGAPQIRATVAGMVGEAFEDLVAEGRALPFDAVLDEALQQGQSFARSPA